MSRIWNLVLGGLDIIQVVGPYPVGLCAGIVAHIWDTGGCVQVVPV